MKKGIKLLAVASFFAISLCSCGNDDTVEQKTGTNTNEKTPQVSQVHFTEEPTTEPEVLIEVNPFEGWDFNEEFVRDEDGRISDEFCTNFWYSEVDEFLKEHGVEARVDLYTLDGKLCYPYDLPENETLVAKLGMMPDKTTEAEGYTERAETNREDWKFEVLTEEDFLDYCKKRGVIFTEISREVVVKVTKDETTEAE